MSTQRAYGYIRVSTKAQAQDDKFGIPEQKDEISTWAGANDIEIIDWFVDDGYSGSNQNRPELQQLLRRLKYDSKPVVVAKMDRWARDTFLHLYLEKELLKQNSELLSVAEAGFNDTDNPANSLMREVMMAFAKFESQRITARMTGGRKQKAKKGGHATGRTPFGYDKDKETGELTINYEESVVVKQIFDLRDRGLSLRAIAESLNASHSTTKSGNKWRAKSVSNILKNKKYRGIVEQTIAGETITRTNNNLKIV